MNISKEYDMERGVVVVTVENPPLPTTKHTIVVTALGDGSVDLNVEITRLRAEAMEKLRIHHLVVEMMN